MADYLNIAGRVRTTASDGVAMEAQEVKDLNLNKSQQDINADVQTELGDRYTKEETYSKEQLDELITTPDVNRVYVIATNLTTAVTDLLPATGSSDTLYNVGNWDGTQYDTTVYSIYGWDGTAYVCLAVRSFIGEVYDISANHPDGHGNPTPYADLTAALGTGGANVPVGIRRGGMSIKFIQGSVQSSDNKYVQYRCMAQNFTTDVTQWQGVDDEPTAGSDNLVKSGGVEKETRPINGIIDLDNLINVDLDSLTKTQGALGGANPCTWTVDQYNRYHKVIPISDVEEVFIKANDNQPTQFIFLKSYTAPTTTGQSMDIALYPIGSITSIIIVPVGETVNMKVPQDANYIVYNTNSNSADKSPLLVLLKKNSDIQNKICYKVSDFDYEGAIRENGAFNITATYKSTSYIALAPGGIVKAAGYGGASTYLLSVFTEKNENGFVAADSVLCNGADIITTAEYQNKSNDVVYIRCTLSIAKFNESFCIVDNTGMLIDDTINQHEQVNLNNFSKVSGALSGANPCTWTIDQYNRYHKAIPITDGTTSIEITANQSLPTTFILLHSYSEPTESGESMDVAAGYSTAINVEAGGKITVTNLSDATYLVITTNSNSDDKSPSKILFNFYEEETEEAVTRLKILTVNPGIYEGKDYAIGDDELLHEYRMAISEASADISFVQADTPYVDIAETKLAKDYVFNMFKHFYNAGDREYNYKSFASYYAIKDVAPVLYTNIEGTYYHYMFMVGTVKIGNKEIHLVNVHFDWRDITIRRQQIAQVINYLSNFEYAIVAGDMNPSGRVNGEFPGGQISIDNYTVYPEDNQIWKNAGFTVANGGILGLYNTDLSKYDLDYPADVKNAIWAWDNIYVKGGYVAKSGLIQKEYMNDHAYIWADVVF